MGRHAQPKEIRENEKEQKTINRCLQSNGELRKIEKLKSHEEKCSKWCESREDPENNRDKIHSIECEENWECECNQYGKWLVQEKKDRECQKKNEFSDIILTIHKSPIDPIDTEGENPERDKKLMEKPDTRNKIIRKPLQKYKKVEQNLELINKTSNKEKDVIEKLGKNPERDKETTKKEKNEVGTKNSRNQAICADANNDPYNNKEHKNRRTEISQYSAHREENNTTPPINKNLLSNNESGPRCRCLQTINHNPEKFAQA